MWPSIGGRIKRCTIRTVPCLQFTQNQNAVELHVWWRHDLEMSNEGGGKFEVKRSRFNGTKM